MITIYDLLQSKTFSNLRVINSPSSLNRPVSTIESSEAPDIYNYIPANTFLLCTAMMFKDDQNSLSDFIRKLHEHSIAALGIKLGRFLDELDPGVIKTADELGFPLILIPEDITLGNLLQQLLQYIWSKENAQFSSMLNIQRKFYNLILRDTSITTLVKSLSDTLDRTVSLIDPFGNIHLPDIDSIKKRYKESIREAVYEFSLNKRSNNRMEAKTISYEGRKHLVYIYSIEFSDHYPYYLLVFDVEELNFNLTQTIIDKAALVIGFNLRNQLFTSYNLMALKENFIDDLIISDHYSNLTEYQLSSIGSKYGIKVAESYQIILGSIKTKDNFDWNKNYNWDKYTLIYNWLDDKLDRNWNNCILFPDRRNLNFIFLVIGEGKYIEKNLSVYKEVLHKTLQLDIIFSLGNKVSHLGELKHSYQEAQEASINGIIKNNLNFIKYYQPLEANDLLRFIPDTQSKTFSANFLKDLAYPQDEFQMDLRTTLKTYLDNNGDITKTAKALFIHRNTVLYRIKKCEELLGRDINDSQFNLGLKLSFLLTDKK